MQATEYLSIRKKLVKEILSIVCSSQEGHIPSSLSVLDIIYYLYNNIIDKNNRFFLSKGHAALGLYAILKEFSFIDKTTLETFCKYDSILGGHPTIKIPGVEASTGSLGHGMPIALGVALAKKIKNESGKVFCLIGDGEANEGTIWESALLASHHKLNNFCCILDHNKSTNRALSIDPCIEKFNSFGWQTFSMNGNNILDIDKTIKEIMSHYDKPCFVLAETIKGFGIECMENNPEWHHKIPNIQELTQIIYNLN